MAWVVFGVFAGIGLLLLMRWLSTSPPSEAKRTLAWTVAGFVVLAAVFLALTGRLAWAGAAISALIPWATRAIRVHALWSQFRNAFGRTPPPPGSRQEAPRPGQRGMSEAEAYAVLGLKPGASKDEIQKAYKRLIQKMHPDAGGSGHLAAQINEARDVLIGRR